MKILSVRLKNLNSLSGEWKIDFTAPQYESDGIFLISGPTGSGKTTILDAICLALYGRTPRQKSFSNNINEMMPSDQRESMAEVTFETRGVRYRSMWTHERTRRARDPFKSPQFYLEKADSDIPLGKNEEAKKQIEKIIGMNFEQFTRSMLLAQGNFASFLQSKPSERAELLEQITGTEIYSQISTKVFDLEKYKAQQIKFHKEELEKIEILDDKALSELREEIALTEKSETECRASQEALKTLMDWKKLLMKLEKEMAAIIDQEIKLGAADEAFEADREKLALAERAALLEAQWAVMLKLRADLKGVQEKYASGEKALPCFKDLWDRARENHLKAASARVDAENLFNNSSQMLARAQSLDSLISDKENILHLREAERKKVKEKLEKYISEKMDKSQSLEKEEKCARELNDWLDRNASYVNIAVQIPLLERDDDERAAIEGEIKNLQDTMQKRRGELEQYETSLGKAGAEFDKLLANEKEMKINRESLVAQLTSILGQDSLSNLQAELDRIKMERERRLLLNRGDVQDLRARLAENTPCPVCGALHHPFAEGQIPAPEDMEQEIAVLGNRIKGAAEVESKINELDRNAVQLSLHKKDWENKKNSFALLIETSKKAVEDIEKDIKNRRCHLEELLARCAKIFDTYGLDAAEDSGTALVELKKRKKEWEDKLNLREKLRNNIADIKARLGACAEGEKQSAEAFKKLDQECGNLREEYENSVRERKREYGDLNAAKVKELEKLAQDAKKAEEEAARKERTDNTNYVQCAAELDTLKKSLDQLEKEEQARADDFNLALMREKFADESTFLTARLSREERVRLQERDRLLRDEKLQLMTRKSDKEKELKTEKERQLTSETLEELEARGQNLNEALKNITNKMDNLKSLLKRNEENVEKAGDKKAELELLKKDHEIYARLNELIGQKSGDKFRQFAQGLTLEILVTYANRELKKMSDRYQLVLDERKALELSISDNYKAGEKRATSNLSGGESFIVSLALALGLASLSSKKAQVDSLFLDEGFGTLDEKCLETILNTLVNLKHEGKLIGLISHVGLFRERLNTVIEVSGTGGKSVLEGPGCSRC